jgi:hypothetical protein
MQSCASRLPGGHAELPCDDGVARYLAARHAGRGMGMQIRGSVRIDLPRFRVRGICTIRANPAGDVRIDFHHSSLFGAYREDASVFVRRGRIGILDRERGAFFGNDSTLALLRDYLEFNVMPDDLAYLLLFVDPDCAGITDARFTAESGRREESGDWRLQGSWRDRAIEIEGQAAGEPIRFRQCRSNGTHCYIARYEYSGDDIDCRYPAAVTLESEYGSRRLSMAVRDVRRRDVGEGVFEIFDALEP